MWHCRLEDISGDAELQEKSHSDLHRLGQIVMEQCQITMTEHEKQLENGTPEDNDGKRNVKFSQLSTIFD